MGNVPSVYVDSYGAPTTDYGQCTSYSCPTLSQGFTPMGTVQYADGSGSFYCEYRDGSGNQFSCSYTADGTPRLPPAGTNAGGFDTPDGYPDSREYCFQNNQYAQCDACPTGYTLAENTCQACLGDAADDTLYQTPKGDYVCASLVCGQGQVVLDPPFLSPLKPRCVACTDPALLGDLQVNTGNVLSFGIDSNGVCDAQTCATGSGLTTDTNEQGLTGSVCRGCDVGQYSPGGATVCMTCSGTTDLAQTTCTPLPPASPKARARNRRAATDADRAIAARQYRYPRSSRKEARDEQ